MKKQLTIFVVLALVLLVGTATAAMDLEIVSIDTPTTMFRDTTYFYDVTMQNNGPDDYLGGDDLTLDDGDGTITTHLLPIILNQSTHVETNIPVGYINLGTFTVNASIIGGFMVGGTDSDGTNDFLEFDVTIVNQIPTVANPGTINHIVGTELLLDVDTITTELDAADTLSYSLTGTVLPGMTIDSVTGEVENWIPMSTGTYTFSVEVDDGNDQITESFSVVVLPDQPLITFLDTEIVFGDASTPRTSVVLMTATVENSGTQDLFFADVELRNEYGNTILGAPYNPVISIGATTLVPSQSAVVTVSIEIPADADSEKTDFGSLYVRAENVLGTEVTDEIDAFTEAETKLDIEDCDVEVDGDSESCSGTVEVKEGNEIEFTINVENLYNNDDIEDVYVEITDNNGWDIEEESNEHDIDGGDDYEFTISFTLDEEINDDDTQILIEVFGDDGNQGFEHYASLTFDFEIDRDNDDVAITEMEFLTNPIYNDAGFVDLEIEIRNIGTDDQNEAAIRVVNAELGVDMKISDIEIDDGDSETERFQIELPDGLEEGAYVFNVYSYYNDNSLTDSDMVTLDILDYGNPFEEEEEGEGIIVVNPPSTPQSGVIANPTYGTSTRANDKSWYVVLLFLLVFAAIAGIIYFALDIMASNKKAKAKEARAKAADQKPKAKKTTAKKATTKGASKKTAKKSYKK